MKDNKAPISEDTIGLLVHSYNNYLSGLMGFTELALMECKQEIVKDRLEMSMDSGKEAVEFGKQLLSSIGRLQVVLKPFDFKLLINQFTEQEELSVNMSSLVHGTIRTDSDWFLSCLNAVINFCRDYSKLQKNELSDISITVKQQAANTVSISILNSIHFNEEQTSQLFNPFFTSRTLLGKKGVGLSMVCGFVKQMKGDIKWKDGEGFVMTLPLVSL